MNYKSMIFFLIIVLMSGGLMSKSKESDNNEIILDGEKLIAWNICYSSFLKIEDLSKEEKKLENYEIEFHEDNKYYIILFSPKLLSEEKAKSLNKMVLGRETKYWVDKQSFKIAKRLFYKS